MTGQNTVLPYLQSVPIPRKPLTDGNEGGYDSTNEPTSTRIGGHDFCTTIVPATIIQSHRQGRLRMLRVFQLRILSCIMVVVFPITLLAADLPGAMLYSHGTALLNGNSISRSSAIFAG